MAVGRLGLNPTAFYSCEPREIELAIEGYAQGKKEDFFISQTALVNAIGMFFGGKKFKQTDPFATRSKVAVITVEQKLETFDYLQNKFERR